MTPLIDLTIVDRLERSYYAPTDSMELYDRQTNTYYDLSHNKLKHPDEVYEEDSGMYDYMQEFN